MEMLVLNELWPKNDFLILITKNILLWHKNTIFSKRYEKSNTFLNIESELWPKKLFFLSDLLRNVDIFGHMDKKHF